MPGGRVRFRAGLVSRTRPRGWYVMSGKSDQVKGRAKEAAGILTGNKELESEGKADRRTGEAKEKVDHFKDKVDDVTDKAKAKVDGMADKVKDALDRK
jgi:uncharacterized protein YjbJ (UPF0337 family)